MNSLDVLTKIVWRRELSKLFCEVINNKIVFATESLRLGRLNESGHSTKGKASIVRLMKSSLTTIAVGPKGNFVMKRWITASVFFDYSKRKIQLLTNLNFRKSMNKMQKETRKFSAATIPENFLPRISQSITLKRKDGEFIGLHLGILLFLFGDLILDIFVIAKKE